MKSFFDHQYLMDNTYEKVLRAIKDQFPFESNKKILQLNNIWVDEKNFSINDLKKQKDAMQKHRSWEVPVYADISLIDKTTGKVIDRSNKLRIVSIPFLTSRYSYIVNGSEYQVPTQMRLKPGIYTHKKGDGKYRGWFNLAKGIVREFAVYLNPETRKLTLAHGTTKSIPLYPVLIGMGVSDAEIRQAWGDEIYNINKKQNIPAAISTLYKTMFNYEAASETEALESINTLFKESTMDLEVNEMTMGKKIDHVSANTLLDVSKKVLEVAQGKKGEDDRDSLVFKNIMSTDDFLEKRIRDSVQRIKRKLNNNLKRKDTVKDILTYDIFSIPVKTFFTSTSLSNVAEHSSPLGYLSEQSKITPLGEGGIENLNQISDSARALNPSHFGFIDPSFTPDNDRAGTVLHLSMLAGKEGTDLKIYVYDVKNKKSVPITPKQSMGSVVAFANQYRKKDSKNGITYSPISNMVDAIKGGEILKVKPEEVDYIFLKDSLVFSLDTNLIPFLQHNQGNRTLLSAKMLHAAIALKDPEAPKVMSEMTPGNSIEKFIGGLLNQKSPVPGVVTSIDKDVIKIKDKEGKIHNIELYNKFHMGESSFMDSTPVVKVGDKVTPEDFVAVTNYSDKEGNFSYGKNLKVGYLSYKGLNTDDSIVISEEAAKKLTSEHIYKIHFMQDDATELNLKRFRANFPSAMTEVQASKLDSEGVVKVGSILNPDDIVMAILRKETPSVQDIVLKKLYKRIALPYKNRMKTWQYSVPGKVIDAIKHGKYVDVYIQTEEPATIGDKLTSRYGAKGIITQILPNSEIPKNAKGEPLEVIMSPAVITTRMNVGQVLETVATKISDKTGKPYLVTNFPEQGDSYLDTIKEELKKLGLSDTEILFDSDTGKELGEVLAGEQYIIKLKQQIRTKMGARGGGTEEYSINRSPKGGGPTGGQALGHLGLYAMLAQGAPANLYEMNTYKSDMNPDFWDAVRLGLPLPPPKTPFAYEKFIGYLKTLGIDVEKIGNSVSLMPMTDMEVSNISNGAIDATKIIRGKDLKPERNGLFDEEKTGGEMGDRWTHINLADVIPNPVFEDAIISVLGITGKTYEDIITGKLGVDITGKISDKGNYKRGEAFSILFDKINVKQELAKLSESIKNSSGAELAKNRKRFKVLRSLDNTNISPKEAYLRKKIPVLPPYFRPIVQLDTGSISTDDLNNLYKNIAIMNGVYKEAKELLPESEVSKNYATLYDAVKSLELTGARIGGKQYKSVMDLIKGNSPKEGFFQRALLNKRKQEVSGRSVIIPNTSISLDNVGLPETMAWKIYEPFIVRRLVRQGYKPNEATKLIDDRHSFAKKALELEMSERPVIMKRDPVLHKFGVMAMKPILVEGDAIQTHPLHNKSYGFDYDGDCVSTCIYSLFSIKFAKKYGLLGEVGKDLDLEIDSQYYSNSNDKILVGGNTMLAGAEKVNLVGKLIHIKDFPKTGEPMIKGNKTIYKVPDGAFIYSYDLESNSVKLVPILEYSIHEDLELVRVKTRFSREVVASKDHSLFCINDEFELVKATPEASFGKLTPRPKALSSEELDEIYLGDYYTPDLRDRPKHRINHTLELNYQTGFTWGLMVGEGWSDYNCKAKPSGVNFFSVEDDVINYVKEGFIKYSCDTLNFYTHESHNKDFYDGKFLSRKITCNCLELSSLTSSFIGSGAVNKHLPPFYLQACKDFRLGMLAGLIAGDGTISISHAKGKRPQIMTSYCTISEILAKEVSLLATSLGIRSSVKGYKKTHSITEGLAYYTWFSAPDFKQYKGKFDVKHPKKKQLFDQLFDWDWREETNPILMKNDIVPINKELANILTKNYITSAKNKNLYYSINKGSKSGYISRTIAKKILNKVPTILMLPYGAKWKSIVENTDIFWDVIDSVTPAPEEGTTAYDFSVPGSMTFMTADQLIVYDTLSIFVPVTTKAVNELGKLLPSNNLFSPTNGKVIFYPSQEAQLGLYLMTAPKNKTTKSFKSPEEAIEQYKSGKIKIDDGVKIGGTYTTAGVAMLNKELPSDIQFTGPLTSKVLITTITKLAKKYPKSYATVIDKFKEYGFNNSYTSGFSLKLDDFSPPAQKGIDKIWEKADKAVLGKNLSEEDIIMIFAKAKQDSDNLVEEELKDSNNNLYTMTISGAKGKMLNLNQILGSVGLVDDLFGDVNPYPIKSNFSKGLPIAEFLSHFHGARKGSIEKVKAVKDPGYLTKQLVNNLLDSVVVAKECGTKRGIMMKTDDLEVVDRFTSQAIDIPGGSTYPRNTLIVPDMLVTLRKHKINTIIVRSPLRCEMPQGLCQMCLGLNEKGELHPIGDHVGVKATQSIGEPSVQFSLSSWHKGGVIEKTISPVARLQQLLQLPKYVKNKATLSITYGKVEEIVPSAVGGFDVTIRGKKHWVPKEQILKVKIGDEVKKGQVISTGYIDPRELLELRGVEATQNYLSDELYKVLQDVGPVKRKNIELVVRAIAGLGEITDSGGHPNYIKGDVVPVSKLNYFNKNDRFKMMSPNKAVGLRLGQAVGDIHAGEILTEEMLQNIKFPAQVEIALTPVEYDPIIKGINVAPLEVIEDWMAKLNFHHIKDTIIESGMYGASSDLHGLNPIPAVVEGTEILKAHEDLIGRQE